MLTGHCATINVHRPSLLPFCLCWIHHCCHDDRVDNDTDFIGTQGFLAARNNTLTKIVGR